MSTRAPVKVWKLKSLKELTNWESDKTLGRLCTDISCDFQLCCWYFHAEREWLVESFLGSFARRLSHELLKEHEPGLGCPDTRGVPQSGHRENEFRKWVYTKMPQKSWKRSCILFSKNGKSMKLISSHSKASTWYYISKLQTQWLLSHKPCIQETFEIWKPGQGFIRKEPEKIE